MDVQVPVGQSQPPKCIPAPQVLNQLLCLTVFRGMLKKEKKKKERWPTEFIGFNFLCLKMTCVVFMLVVSNQGGCCHRLVGREGVTAGECLLGHAAQSSLPKADDTSLTSHFQVSVCSVLAAGDSSEGTQFLPAKSSQLSGDEHAYITSSSRVEGHNGMWGRHLPLWSV